METIDRKSLYQLVEDECLEAVRPSIRVEGHGHVLDAMFFEGGFVHGALKDQETDNSDKYAEDSDDFASSSDDRAPDEAMQENLDYIV